MGTIAQMDRKVRTSTGDKEQFQLSTFGLSSHSAFAIYNGEFMSRAVCKSELLLACGLRPPELIVRHVVLVCSNSWLLLLSSLHSTKARRSY